MIKFKIDNSEFEAAEGSTILEAAKNAGLSIPTLCHKHGMPHYSSCMVCMVKDKNTNKYLPSCSSMLQEGMNIDISCEDVISLRKTAVEMLLSEHRAECEAPCSVVCPEGYNIPLMNRLLMEYNYDGAVELTSSEINSHEIKCIECPGYCENACRRKKIDLPVSIRNMKLFIYQHITSINPINPITRIADNNQKVKQTKPFSSRIGKLEPAEQLEWLKECPGEVKRYREIADFKSAASESGSCMHCDCRAANDCRLRDISEAFSIKDPRGKIVNSPIVKKINYNTGLVFENAKCIKCGLCVRLCEDSTDEPSLCFIHRGFVSIISEPLTEDFNNILKTRSNDVIEICPTGALGKFIRQKGNLLTLVFAIFLFMSTYSQTGNNDWLLFRGRADLSGRYDSEFPSAPALQWSLSTGSNTKSSPVISDGTLFFGNDKGSLISVSSDGKIKWKYEAGSQIEAAPLIFGNKVIVGLNDGKLIAVDKVTGKLIWTYTTENQISGSANVWLSGSKAGIVVGSYDYFLHCVDPKTGKLIWKIETDNYVNGTPSIQEGKIVFGGCDGVIRVVDPLSGMQKDTIDVGVYIAASPALSGDMAYFGDYDGTIFGLNIRTKKMVWKIPGNEQSGSILAVPAIGNNYVVIGNEDKFVYCYNASNGKLIWKYRTNGRIIGSAVITQLKVLITSMDGTVSILDLTNGKKLWSFNAGTPISSSPAVIMGKFYILTEDGRLLAFADKPLLTK